MKNPCRWKGRQRKNGRRIGNRNDSRKKERKTRVRWMKERIAWQKMKEQWGERFNKQQRRRRRKKTNAMNRRENNAKILAENREE